jgi:hypothetical protein
MDDIGIDTLLDGGQMPSAALLVLAFKILPFEFEIGNLQLDARIASPNGAWISPWRGSTRPLRPAKTVTGCCL